MTHLSKSLILSGLLAVLALGGCGESSSNVGNELANLRGARYCEVLAVFADGGLRADVYGTQGLSDCPLSQWKALDPQAIQEELGAFAVVMNGPRFWLIDAVKSFSEPGDVSQAPYTERSVVRDTEFLFLSGSEVYELIAPSAKVYVMQSYAHIVDDTLNEAALPALGESLALPEGWVYRTRVVDEDYVVVDQDGVATVDQDELQNTYQLAGLEE